MRQVSEKFFGPLRVGLPVAAVAVVLAGCASAPPAQVAVPMPAQWHGGGAAHKLPLPHAGSVQQLLDWWRDWNDPLLADLVAAAEQASPDLASAAAKIAQARAGAEGSQAAMLPALDARAGVQRTPASTQSVPNLPPHTNPVINVGQVGAQLQWELDLFGGLRHASGAAQARLAGAQAQWHQARVSLAADTANQYFAVRACQDNLALTGRDADSRADTARLTGDLTRAGFAAPATLALTQASAAQAQAQRRQIEAQCTAAIKALSALTAMDEDTLRQRLLAQAPGRAPALSVAAMPVHVLEQRPDVYAAAQAVAAASGDVGQADAQRYPRVTLGANVARIGINIPAYDTTMYQPSWSIGPLAISIPLFDGGRRQAQLESSQAQYAAAVVQYRAAVRQAVRDVETALSELDSTRQRSASTDAAVKGFAKAYQAANAKYRAGMGSKLELEDARRNYLQAQTAHTALQQQSRNAWVALYRALGGGWQLPSNATEADRVLAQAGARAGAAPAATATATTPLTLFARPAAAPASAAPAAPAASAMAPTPTTPSNSL